MSDLHIQVNGQAFTLSEPQTVGEFVAGHGLSPTRCVVELDGKALRHPEFANLPLADGNVLEIISIVAGG